MTSHKPAVWVTSLHLTVASLFSLVLMIAVVGILFSQYAALFGPIWGFLVGVVGCVLGVAGAFYSERWFTRVCPEGLSTTIPSLIAWRRLSRFAASTAATIWFIAVVTLCLSVRFDGELTDAASPVFWPREKYELKDHAKVTPISQLRYWTIATSFSVTWHSFAMLLTIVALRGFLFGERLEATKVVPLPKMDTEPQRSG